MPEWHQQRLNNQTLWYDPECFAHFSADCFEPAWWQARDAVVGQSRGRGVTWFVREGTNELVLRHYWRGGLIGRLIADRFCFAGVARSRAMAEFVLLQRLREAGLPVPRPAAARLVRQGAFYRADILIERIPKARDLVAILKERALSVAEWRTVGGVIARLHQAGGYHADLNSHNLMLDASGQVWIIDFDKGAIRKPGSWQEDNLARLHRSFVKEAGLHAVFYWQDADWQALLAGYEHRLIAGID